MSRISSSTLFKRLLGYSFRYWIGFAVAIVAMVVTAITETAFPAMMKPLMDKGFQGAATFQIWWVPVAVLLIFITRGLATFLSTYAMQWVSNNVLRDLRHDLFEKLITLPTTTFDARSSGQLISKMISDAQMVLLAATNVLTVIVRDSLILFGLLGWLLWLNWKLTLVVIFLMPILAYLTLKFSRRMRGISRNYLSAIGDMTASVEEAVAGNRIIKIFDGRNYELRRFDNVNADYRSQAMRLAVASALQSPITQLIAAIGVAIVLTIALTQSRSGGATIGDFVSFITAMLMMFSPLRHLADVNSQLQRGLAAAEGVFQMLDERSEGGNGRLVFKERILGHISFQNVTFKYPTRETSAIVNLSLEIPAGQTYALVGPSGSGKSTLVNLLPRLYEIDSGVIRLDGTDIKEITLKSLRDQIALVSQDIVLFNDTIGANIAYGRNDISKEQINDAVRVANLESFISSLPFGLDTVVGDRGVRISGGQRQRIAIARAVIKDAPILILDEATSALDTKSEVLVQDAIEKLRTGRTTLIVAHRLSTVVNADKIVVLEHGQCVQSGRHEELIKQVGLYRTLYSEIESNEQH